MMTATLSDHRLATVAPVLFGAVRDGDARKIDLALFAVRTEAEGHGIALPGDAEIVAEARDFVETSKALDRQASAGEAWPEPQPLTARIESEPYPIDAVPDVIRDAVEEVRGFVQAPAALVATSALAAASIAAQAHVDVQRLEKLSGPSGIFLLTIAESGERKSTCDSFFSKSILDYEVLQAEAAKPLIKDHRAALESWNAKCSGVKEKIRSLAKEGKPTREADEALRGLEHDRPVAPRVPRLLYADTTPEALCHCLAKTWPSGAVVSAEAGIVFGGHGMGADSVVKNLSTLNQLWDGKTFQIDRRTSESFQVRGARLTMALQIQEATLREFLAKSGALARGSGFLARFLIAWPTSTQGTRHIDPAAPDGPKTWPRLAAFHRRITEILAQVAPMDEGGGLVPIMLAMDPAAKSLWVDFHNRIETELRDGGELRDVRDVASKTADNAARLAGLFHVMGHGIAGHIGADDVERGATIAAWHLSESRRFFGEIAQPQDMADAVRVDRHLIDVCRRDQVDAVPAQSIQQRGPGAVRRAERLGPALAALESMGRVRVRQKDGRKTVFVNPTLLGGAR